MTNILNEYLSILDPDEVCNCVEELPTGAVVKFISQSIGEALERKSHDREKIATMLTLLYEHNVIEAEDIQEGFLDHFEFFEDIRVDIPRLEQYVAQIVSPMIRCGALSLTWVGSKAQHLIESGIAVKLIHEIIECITRDGGVEKINTILQEAKFADGVWDSLTSVNDDQLAIWLKDSCCIQSEDN